LEQHTIIIATGDIRLLSEVGAFEQSRAEGMPSYLERLSNRPWSPVSR
jgi:hypothetical protein